MIETYEDIQATLQVLGQELTFTDGTIYGIPDFQSIFDDSIVQTNIQIESLEYSFSISTKDSVATEISVGSTFTTLDDTYTYTYKVSREQLVLGNGWSKLPANRISKELL